ncbi:amino acid ABC transporter [Gordoniibacillus kamchatkensis]|uniref:Amino acid ABC transporter n=1 Tax=Gordoniibacillus kamchatkensis TaxID=1590651 RepID=A0ABR5AFW5_9BACL|nr:transporter substrate-binding domain-containing protein [Paenibacillus sp. VKM B-2647]KIL39944.1 amino acid ABC transporter [Paenibacillus sp. VKM B-2647]
MKKFATVAAALLLTMGIATACGQKDQPASTNAAAPAADKKETTSAAPNNPFKAKGKLVVGTSADYPPYEFHKLIDGKDQIVGFDIDIANAIAKDLGVEMEIKDMKFDGLLPALDTGNIDMIAAGMSPTDDRKKNVDFTKIYYTAAQGVVVRAEDKDKFKTLDDLKGLKIGVQKGSIQEKIAQEQIANAQLKSLGKISDIVAELKSKRVDAIVVELPVAQNYVNKNKDLTIAPAVPKDDTGGSALAFKKGIDPKVLEQVNKTLDKLNADKKIDEFVAKANEMVE